MAVKCGSGPRTAAHTAKRRFLNCLETSLTFHSPAFLHCQQSSAQRTVSQSQNTMAVKYGSGPRPAAHTAKRRFLNCLETSLRPSIRPPSCTAIKAPLKGRSRRDLPFARLAALPSKLRSKDGRAEPKYHGSEVRIVPAAGSPYCPTLLSELPRN